MLYSLACEARALSQSFFNSRLRCHQAWEAFPPPQAVTPVPLPEHLQGGQDTPWACPAFAGSCTYSKDRAWGFPGSCSRWPSLLPAGMWKARVQVGGNE